MKARIVLSCEHAGNEVPPEYRPLFAGDPEVLETHRGYDIGIAPVAEKLRRRMDCPLVQYRWTRLLIDPNRTVEKSLFSEFSRTLPDDEKARLTRHYYAPYHARLDRLIGDADTLHLSLHSFTPVFNGKERKADLGILFDPARPREAVFSTALQHELKTATGLRVFRNYPYRGTADGTTTRLRKQLGAHRYLGIEIEISQALLSPADSAAASRLPRLLADSIAAAAQVLAD
ncbi:N-formylglutamate amidohydrolase [Pontiella sp.]|uniref:N-formylglutamate amidohydrolase n=1 Tax=Pontiella sp. TaxID=2837462 RepID=UPI00356A0292